MDGSVQPSRQTFHFTTTYNTMSSVSTKAARILGPKAEGIALEPGGSVLPKDEVDPVVALPSSPRWCIQMVPSQLVFQAEDHRGLVEELHFLDVVALPLDHRLAKRVAAPISKPSGWRSISAVWMRSVKGLGWTHQHPRSDMS